VINQFPARILVLSIEAPQPVGKPTTAGFEKAYSQGGVTFEHSPLDQGQQSHHLFHGMGAGMKGETALKAIGSRTRQATVGGFVKTDGTEEKRCID
jgi:hypothetical protein